MILPRLFTGTPTYLYYNIGCHGFGESCRPLRYYMSYGGVMQRLLYYYPLSPAQGD